MSKNSKDEDHPAAGSPAGGGFESVRVKLDDALEKDREDTEEARKRLLHGGNRANQTR
ncbi:hypothetical protein [Novosphingobium rosa]|uniref:hypothetical protein n=1 Tax=Novosphingobium rosa TaxID=76978 RepID=UPI000A5D18E3|nr:hypothetical protein [Novosphingobium rosa]